MGRWSQYDTDEERLPSGMERIGYDADEEIYTFRDSDGSIWQSAPGSRYGQLRRVSGPPAQPERFDQDIDLEGSPPPPYESAEPEVSWRHEMMPLFNWFLVIGLFLLGVFWYLNKAAAGERTVPEVHCSDRAIPYSIRPGDTCWALAENRGVSLDVFLEVNVGLDCDKLGIGETVCLPKNT
ncbi:uncharacterized protein BCR38DRAFT_340146 [Pseudomassariella vexata]|uniref:LysM domain-containing protein n=1 Tax=Pseudomassariella vexata TaxID=1141098 RepID=A0A1Y2E3X9_9PEZI|nr:uncharacterized protein BCR38DRAFT_340146 [Pseudomassariella vexata]ORY66232.1 hypothetical protein BCR38DRAFT_340146 [Pseudomassariella vexata]